MPKVAISTGYYATGSSAVLDFFKDMKNTLILDIDEVRFLQDPYGVSDLEFNLVENPHRHNSPNAIKLFKREVCRLEQNKRSAYFKMFNGQFKKISFEYIDQLVDFSFLGYCHTDEHNLAGLSKVLFKIKKIFGKFLHFSEAHNYLPKNVDYCSWPTEDKFLDATKQYTKKLTAAASLNAENLKLIAYDQLIPASNAKRYLRYLDDAKLIIVDRDPRDIYTQIACLRPDHVIPTDISQFCLWYRKTRLLSDACLNSENIMHVDFEDFVREFEGCAHRICDFIGIPFDEKKHVCKCFDPAKSINNVHVYKKYPQISKQIKIIEKELNEYLIN